MQLKVVSAVPVGDWNRKEAMLLLQITPFC